MSFETILAVVIIVTTAFFDVWESRQFKRFVIMQWEEFEALKHLDEGNAFRKCILELEMPCNSVHLSCQLQIAKLNQICVS